MTTYSPQYDDVLQKAMQLSTEEREALKSALTYYELAHTLKPFEDFQQTPLSPADVIAQGLTGTWDDPEIMDGADWVNDQKAKRQDRRQW